MNYDLSHLTQDTRRVYGPIQDDEALLLYALVRCLGVRVVIEAGGQTGYSARNFLAAGADVVSIDINPMQVLDEERHTFVHSSIGAVGMHQLPRCDLVFYDSHAEEEQYGFHKRAVAAGVINSRTTVVVHDTGLHSQQFVPWAVQCNLGWAHQPAERRFTERLVADGWQRVHVHDDAASEPRHGLTILQRPRSLA
jgi:hypothetical protein